jgi:hypothetical protein
VGGAVDSTDGKGRSHEAKDEAHPVWPSRQITVVGPYEGTGGMGLRDRCKADDDG